MFVSELCDNAKELFSTYIITNGILHESSYVDTLSKNGVAERKNKHLLETTTTLLFRMKVLKTIVVDATFIACFLINQMPLYVLNGESPYHMISNKVTFSY